MWTLCIFELDRLPSMIRSQFCTNNDLAQHVAQLTMLTLECLRVLHVVLMDESWYIMMNVVWVESSGCQVISN